MKEGDAEIVFLGTGSSMPGKYRNVTGIFLDQPALGSMFMDVVRAGADCLLIHVLIAWSYNLQRSLTWVEMNEMNPARHEFSEMAPLGAVCCLSPW